MSGTRSNFPNRMAYTSCNLARGQLWSRAASGGRADLAGVAMPVEEAVAVRGGHAVVVALGRLDEGSVEHRRRRAARRADLRAILYVDAHHLAAENTHLSDRRSVARYLHGWEASESREPGSQGASAGEVDRNRDDDESGRQGKDLFPLSPICSPSTMSNSVSS
eukprot:2343357-Rhodomonas_salina.2